MVAASLWLEMPIFGAASLWGLALIPAAVVSTLKGRWLLFAVGWLTLGITWTIGAVGLAPPDSWWARRFYGEDRMARATDPLRHPRSRHLLALWSAGLLATILALGLFAARPSPILGIDGGALENSVGGSVLFETKSCQPMSNGTWVCEKYDDQFSDTVSYGVQADGAGCWTATLIGPPNEETDKRVSGCITILDHLLG